MGLFLTITYQSQGGSTAEKAYRNQKVLSYIIDSLNDQFWQYPIAAKLRKLDEKYTHITLSTILRFFDQKNIDLGKLKSYARYFKKDDKLVIDQMLPLNKYETLSEDETRNALCDDIFDYFQEIILKYKDRFLDFDAVSFVPLLKQRFEEIKKQKYISKRKVREFGLLMNVGIITQRQTFPPLTQRDKEMEYRFFENYVNFLQENGFTTREILKKNEKATDESKIYKKDLTEEGLNFYTYEIGKWRDKYRKTEGKYKVINDFSFIEKRLKKI